MFVFGVELDAFLMRTKKYLNFVKERQRPVVVVRNPETYSASPRSSHLAC